MSDENTYAVRVFSRRDYSLSGAEYRSATPPKLGDEIEVRWLHGNPDAYGQTPRAKAVRLLVVDEERRLIEENLLD